MHQVNENVRFLIKNYLNISNSFFFDKYSLEEEDNVNDIKHTWHKNGDKKSTNNKPESFFFPFHLERAAIKSQKSKDMLHAIECHSNASSRSSRLGKILHKPFPESNVVEEEGFCHDIEEKPISNGEKKANSEIAYINWFPITLECFYEQYTVQFYTI